MRLATGFWWEFSVGIILVHGFFFFFLNIWFSPCIVKCFSSEASCDPQITFQWRVSVHFFFCVLLLCSPIFGLSDSKLKRLCCTSVQMWGMMFYWSWLSVPNCAWGSCLHSSYPYYTERQKRRTVNLCWLLLNQLAVQKLKLMSYLSCVVDRIAEIYWCLRTPPGFFANAWIRSHCANCYQTLEYLHKHNSLAHQLCSKGLIGQLMQSLLVFTIQKKISVRRTGDQTWWCVKMQQKMPTKVNLLQRKIYKVVFLLPPHPTQFIHAYNCTVWTGFSCRTQVPPWIFHL